MKKPPETVTGFLLRSLDKVERRHLSAVEFVSTIADTRWEEYLYRSARALLGEDLLGAPGPYEYRLFCRRSARRIVVLSRAKRVVEVVKRRLERGAEELRLGNADIDINRLVRHVESQPREYVLSFIHARVPGYGESLNAISFYGEDIAQAQMFRENLKLLDCHTCGLKESDTEVEIRFGSDGLISGPAMRLRSIEAALGYVSKLGFIDD